MNLKLLIIGVVFAALAVASCGRGGSEQIATVNGEAITMDEFVQYLKTKDRVRIITDQGQIVEAPVYQVLGNGQTLGTTLAYQAIEDLISRKLIAQVAKDEQVYPTEREVMAELDFRKKLNAGYVQAQNNLGMTMDRIKDQLYVELATEKLLTKGITVSDADLEKFIKENKLDRDPETADLQYIYVRAPAAKQRVDRELATGASFGTVAVRYSEAPNAKETNARFPVRIVDRLLEPMKSAVRKTPEGRTTDWINLQDGSAKFYVEKKSPEKPLKLDDTRRQLLKREIAKLQGRRAKDLGKRLADKLFASESKILVVPNDLKDMWKQAMDRAKKDRKVSVPTSSEGEGQ